MTLPDPQAGTGPVFGVAALLLAVGDTLAARFGAPAVRGEIAAFSRAPSGHCYFMLKDAEGAPAALRCVMFRRAATLVEFAPADGQQVVVRGRLAVYEARGEMQLVVESLQRVGEGALYEEFLRLRSRLAAEGLFDAGRKRAIAMRPRTLGVVTSRAAAALHDVLSTLARRAPHVRVVVYPSPVQGADAPPALVQALALAARRTEVDTLLLVRGGGSLEDLWAFNDERVVRAVAGSPIPVVCGVGHETDTSLADLAADVRAPTPTAAAELAAPARVELAAALDACGLALVRAGHRVLDRQSQRLDLLARRAGRPAASVAAQGHRLGALAQRAVGSVRRSLALTAPRADACAARLLRAGTELRARRADHLAMLAARLELAHPQHVLARGFAWVERADGTPVLRAAALAAGETIGARFADGRIAATVTATGSAVEGGGPAR
jgi:exodeoxyribonuclease VII large subunit